MIEVHLYGKLHHFTDSQDPTHDSIVYIPMEERDTIADIVRRIGIPQEVLGSNIFLNGEYSALERKAKNGISWEYSQTICNCSTSGTSARMVKVSTSEVEVRLYATL